MFVSKFMRVAGLVAAACLAGSTAHAQSEAEILNAFSGEWQIVDERYSTGSGSCTLSLLQEPEQDNYRLNSEGCGAELAPVSAWGVEDGQMILLDEGGTAIARLGGNQIRMSGNSASGSPIILERVSASGQAEQIEAAHRASGCYYAGFSDDCAPASELAKPATGTPARIEVLVNLNVRAEPRDNADIIGVIPAGSCITTELCLQATDGVWCRAQFQDRSGWMRKLALRRDRWPVVTFYNQCTQ